MEAVWGEVWEVGEEADGGEAGHLDPELSVGGEREVVEAGQEEHA